MKPSAFSIQKSRSKYSLTQKGIDLLPFMVEVILWGGPYDQETEAGDDFLHEAKNNREALLRSFREKLHKAHLEA